MTPQDIKNVMLNLGVAGLGNYTRPDGSTTPALWLGFEPPTTYKVSGIECIITEDNIGVSVPLGSPLSRRWEGSYTVNLVNHSAPPAVFRAFKRAALGALAPLFYRVETESLPGTNLTLEEFRVTCPFFSQSSPNIS